MLWNEYPLLEMHEYAGTEMYEALMDGKRRVCLKLTFYAQCLATIAARDYVLVEDG